MSANTIGESPDEYWISVESSRAHPRRGLLKLQAENAKLCLERGPQRMGEFFVSSSQWPRFKTWPTQKIQLLLDSAAGTDRDYSVYVMVHSLVHGLLTDEWELGRDLTVDQTRRWVDQQRLLGYGVCSPYWWPLKESERRDDEWPRAAFNGFFDTYGRRPYPLTDERDTRNPVKLTLFGGEWVGPLTAQILNATALPSAVTITGFSVNFLGPAVRTLRPLQDILGKAGYIKASVWSQNVQMTIPLGVGAIDALAGREIPGAMNRFFVEGTSRLLAERLALGGTRTSEKFHGVVLALETISKDFWTTQQYGAVMEWLHKTAGSRGRKPTKDLSPGIDIVPAQDPANPERVYFKMPGSRTTWQLGPGDSLPAQLFVQGNPNKAPRKILKQLLEQDPKPDSR